MKIVDLNEKRERCPYCLKIPVCPELSCSRLSGAWFATNSDEWGVEFKDDWKPDDEPPKAA